MNIAEFFVNLGIKGADATVGALGSVKKGLGEVSSMSLEAKAGILAALYGLERLTAISGQAGTSLTNFAALTGVMPQVLQKWQFAARQAGESNEELAGSFAAVQNAMSNTLLGKGAPEGFSFVQRATGLDAARLKDTVYVMEKLNEAAKKLPLEIGNTALKSFGLSEATIAAMRKGVFSDANFAKAPTYSDGEVRALDKANIAWSNLGTKIEMAIGHLNAKHGLTLVNDLSKITTQVFKLVDALTILSEKVKLFDRLSNVLEGISNVFKLINEVIATMGGADAKKGDLLYNGNKEVVPGWSNSPAGRFFRGVGSDVSNTFGNGLPGIGAQLEAMARAQNSHSSPVNINQNIVHHGDAKDTKAVKDLHGHSVNSAFRQRSAQRQGS